MTDKTHRTRRATGRRLLADVSDLLRQRARILEERSRLDLQLAAIDLQHAQKVAEMASADVEPQTGSKRRSPPEPPISHVHHDDLTRRAARAVAKVLPS